TFFHTKWIRDVTPKHLIPTADSQDPSAALQCLEEQLIEAAGNKPSQIRDRVFRSGNNQEIRHGRRLYSTHILQRHAGHTLKRIEVCVIRNVRQTNYAHSE